MKANLEIPERRKTDRLRTNQLASYTRYNTLGQPCEEIIAKLIDVSLKGARLQSSMPVKTGEVLDVTLAFGEKLVEFSGRVTHVTPFKDEGFELGISIDDIEDDQRATLIRFLARIPTWLETSLTNPLRVIA